MMQREFSFRSLFGNEKPAGVAKPDPDPDPWAATIARLKGRIDADGIETISSQQVLDLLQVPSKRREARIHRRVAALMVAHGWEAIRFKPQSGLVDRVRGYCRLTEKRHG
jgi:hypothetical protein